MKEGETKESARWTIVETVNTNSFFVMRGCEETESELISSSAAGRDGEGWTVRNLKVPYQMHFKSLKHALLTARRHEIDSNLRFADFDKL